jgi:AraC-like DNA-binding protein/quercetin dioxygenase-like cupin family protein
MKTHVQKIPLSENSCFMADVFRTPYFETPWHSHPEYELTLIVDGQGKRLVGNHISDYRVGNLAFIGPNLPHLYRKAEASRTGGSLVIHFREDFLGKDFLRIPEMQKIQLLFEKSRMGMNIYGETRNQISRAMQQLLELKGMQRLTSLLSILSVLAESSEYELLSDPQVNSQSLEESDRLNRIFDYVMENFREDIGVAQVAGIALMSYSGFCRYFKHRTKKNFSQFVNEIRVGYACKRLMESDESISRICFESGYNNITNFTKQFKKVLGCTPKQFRRDVVSSDQGIGSREQ